MVRRVVFAWVLVGLQSINTATAMAQSTAPTTDQQSETAKQEAAVPAKEEPRQEAPREMALDPSGTWKWKYTFNDNTADFKLKLDWNGKELKGKYTAFDNTTEIEKAKLEKDQLEFLARREFNGQQFDVNFAGQLKDDEIVGTVTIGLGAEPREFDWHARRAVEIEDVLGEWNLRMETPNGVVEPKLTLKKGENDTLQGTYVSVFGERPPKNLALKENELSWEISSGDDDEFDFKIVYKGRPRGNTIEGSNQFEFGDNTGTMKFTGKRTPPEENRKDDRPAGAKPAEGKPSETAPTTEQKPAVSEAGASAASNAESKD
jgi:hypothetical protein